MVVWPKSKAESLVAIDPGVRGCGVSLWSAGRLARAWYVVSGLSAGGRGAAAVAMGAAVAVALRPYGWRACVVEWPIQRSGAALRANRQDVSDLVGVAAVCAAVCAAGPYPAELITPAPEEWKGQVPKQVHNARVVGAGVARVRLPNPSALKSAAPGQLSPAELSVIEWLPQRALNHNIVDSVGLGLRYYARHLD